MHTNKNNNHSDDNQLDTTEGDSSHGDGSQLDTTEDDRHDKESVTSVGWSESETETGVTEDDTDIGDGDAPVRAANHVPHGIHAVEPLDPNEAPRDHFYPLPPDNTIPIGPIPFHYYPPPPEIIPPPYYPPPPEDTIPYCCLCTGQHGHQYPRYIPYPVLDRQHIVHYPGHIFPPGAHYGYIEQEQLTGQWVERNTPHDPPGAEEEPMLDTPTDIDSQYGLTTDEEATVVGTERGSFTSGDETAVNDEARNEGDGENDADDDDDEGSWVQHQQVGTMQPSNHNTGHDRSTGAPNYGYASAWEPSPVGPFGVRRMPDYDARGEPRPSQQYVRSLRWMQQGRESGHSDDDDDDDDGNEDNNNNNK